MFFSSLTCSVNGRTQTSCIGFSIATNIIQKLEKTEGAMKNGKSRDTSNIARDEDKKTLTQHKELKR